MGGYPKCDCCADLLTCQHGNPCFGCQGGGGECCRGEERVEIWSGEYVDLLDYKEERIILRKRVEDLEAQLLENTDLGWHSLRNQRDDLLKRVAELDKALLDEQSDRIDLELEAARYKAALERVGKTGCHYKLKCDLSSNPVALYCDSCFATEALNPCDPTE